MSGIIVIIMYVIKMCVGLVLMSLLYVVLLFFVEMVFILEWIFLIGICGYWKFIIFRYVFSVF